MNTRAGTITGGIGIPADGGVRSVWGQGAEKFGGGFVGFCRWVADRYDFLVVHRGRRLKPEVRERIERASRDWDEGRREGFSPAFGDDATDEDVRKWLDRGL